MNGTTNDCGCCAGLTAQTPAEVLNRPGLAAIAHRVGTHAQFKQSLLAALSDFERPALQRLRTRDDDDFSIALLDAAATVGDVLTFYQERIANESYLRTATERRSLLELARLIGYELRPGVAASTVLAFAMDESPGAPTATAIDLGTKVQSVPGPNEQSQTFETIEAIEARTAWNALKPQMRATQPIVSGLKQIYLQGTDTQLQPGDALLIVGDERALHPATYPDKERWDVRIVQSVTPNAEKKYTLVTWQDGLGKSPISPASQNVRIFALRQRAALYGHNAPDPRLLSTTGNKLATLLTTDGTQWLNFTLPAGLIDLDAVYAKAVADSWVVLINSSMSANRPGLAGYAELYRIKTASNPSRHDYALSAKITRIQPDTTEHLELYGLRETTAFLQTDELKLAELPLTAPITGATIPLEAAPDGLVKGRLLVASGKDSVTGEAIGEVVSVADISGATLTVSLPLAKSYAREPFSLNANAAHATHGESVSEILGGGDASQPYQRFTLRQSPLTYVSASTPSGAESTLQLRVNDLLWHEAPTLFGRGSKERIFVTRTGDDGKTTVEFGDGANGARLPSGQDNVRANYRKGIGLGGLVKAGQLSLLLTRPLGVKGVTNPQAATGAQDRESLDDARTNAPLTVLTLDRAVSLQDYEDFARAFAGIAKALATWTWDGQTRRVFITVAGPNGAEVKADSDTLKNLVAALQNSGDPFVSFQIKSYRPAFFRFAGSVKVDPDFLTEKVLAAVESALRGSFAFATRAFGQPTMLSEVIATVQAVPGVIAVDVDKLYRADGAAGLNARLLAALPEIQPNGDVAAAELLTLDPAPLEKLGVMS